MKQQKRAEESDEENKLRFEIELEFIQLLANPSYINYLAQNQYLEDQAFVKYLQYLQYWKKPEYSKYIIYPHCLFFLDRLQDEKFRDECKKREFTDYVAKQQGLHWQYYRKNREEKGQKDATTATGTPTSIDATHEQKTQAL